jgi:hypothetical protein
MTVHAVHDFWPLGIGGERDKERYRTILATQRARVLERLLYGSTPGVVRAWKNHFLPDRGGDRRRWSLDGRLDRVTPRGEGYPDCFEPEAGIDFKLARRER